MSTLAYGILRRESFYAPLSAVFGLILLGTIATNLGYVILSADVTVIVAAEILLDSTGAIIELALIDMPVPGHFCVDNGIGCFWICELDNDRGCTLKYSFLS